MNPLSHAIRRDFRLTAPATVGVILAVVALLVAAGCNNFSAAGRNAEGVRLYQQARFPEALRQFQEATYADPENPDGYYNLAATYHRIGLLENRPSDLLQAENYYNQCLDHDENHSDCYRGLAVLLVEQGRNEEAFRLLEGWVDRQPDVADAKIELARLFEEFGDKAAAKQHLIESLAIESTNARALAALGKIREEMGENAQALANYQRSYANDRFQPQLASRISTLRSQLGQTTSTVSPQNGTRLVNQPAPTLR